MVFVIKGIFFLFVICSIDCASTRRSIGHRQSKATNLGKPIVASQIEPLQRSSYELNGELTPNADPSKQNIYYTDPAVSKSNPNAQMGATFENIPPNYIGPNYMVNGGGNVAHRNLQEEGAMPNSEMGPGMGFLGLQPANMQPNSLHSYFQNQLNANLLNKPQSPGKPSDDTMNDAFNNAFKKYNVKKYLLSKIFGNNHELDDDENGFFSNTHLKRHGTAGMAAKVIGELIGIKIRESIEGFGKSFSEYAKDFTARNFVNIGQVFSKMLKIA